MGTILSIYQLNFATLRTTLLDIRDRSFITGKGGGGGGWGKKRGVQIFLCMKKEEAKKFCAI